MKNSFKMAFVALALATTFTACGGSSDSDNDTTVIETNTTVDSNITVDSNVTIDTTGGDTGAKM